MLFGIMKHYGRVLCVNSIQLFQEELINKYIDSAALSIMNYYRLFIPIPFIDNIIRENSVRFATTLLDIIDTNFIDKLLNFSMFNARLDRVCSKINRNF